MAEAVANPGSNDAHMDDNVEHLTLIGNAQINAYGNELGNVIIGNSRPNVILGSHGRDVMTGGAGADRFDFNTR